MRTTRGSRIAAAAALALMLSGSAADAEVAGTVTEITKHEVTVNGARYEIEQGTSLEDQNGRPIALPEIRPGTPVELELDGEGRLGVLRATVVR